MKKGSMGTCKTAGTGQKNSPLHPPTRMTGSKKK